MLNGVVKKLNAAEASRSTSAAAIIRTVLFLRFLVFIHHTLVKAGVFYLNSCLGFCRPARHTAECSIPRCSLPCGSYLFRRRNKRRLRQRLLVLLERVLPCSDYAILKREADKRVWAVRHSPKRFHALLGSYLNNRSGCALPLNEIQAYQCSLHHATTSSTHHDAGSPQPVSAILSVAFSCSLSSPFSLRRLAIFLFISVIISL